MNKTDVDRKGPPAPVLTGTFNAEQRAAIEYGDGALCIVAGPGSGKTRTLTARIAYLLQQARIQSEHIIALTFTNKAAHEMRERVAELLGVGATPPLISTFHALARTLLDDETPLVDESMRVKIIHDIMHTRHMKGRSVRDIGLDISLAKNQLKPTQDPVLAELVQAYNAALTALGLQDFDDLLRNLHEALAQRTLPQKPPFQHILVDEFQDTNTLQYAILRLLDTTGNVFVIGDPLQSIYGFRGANAGVFDQFEHDWPNVKRITLHVNYRSAPEIVGLANALFPDAPQLLANRQEPGKTCAVEVLNEYGEADWIIGEIERQLGGTDMLRSSRHHAAGTGRTFRNFAVLYRTHAAAKTLQASLEASGIPYQIAGEGSPYFDPTVRAILQALEFMEGRTTELVGAAGFTASQLHAILSPLKNNSIVPEVSNLATLTALLIEKLGFSYDKHPALRQFTNSLLGFSDMTLSAYLDHVAAIAEQAYYDPAAEAVTLLTIHAAKGLEFPCVFLIGAEEGILPHMAPGNPDAHQSEQSYAEEKRLFYVAITRARDELYLLHARTRRKEPRTISSFVSDLPIGIIDYLTDSELGNQQRKLQRRAAKRAQGSLF